MAWRSPRYCFLHIGRDAGASAITPSPAVAADFPVDNLIDDRAGSLYKFGSSTAGSTLTIDRGASGLEAIQRMIIPSGHNITGTIELDTDNDVGFGSPTALLGAEAVSTGLIDETFDGDATSDERYVRITFNETGTIELPQLIFTTTNSTTRGPVTPGYRDELVDVSAVFPKQDGSVATLSLGPNARRFEFEYRILESADEAIFAALFAEVGTTKPFYIDPPYDTEAVLWVRLVEPPRRTLDTIAPQSEAQKYRRILTLEEWLA